LKIARGFLRGDAASGKRSRKLVDHNSAASAEHLIIHNLKVWRTGKLLRDALQNRILKGLGTPFGRGNVNVAPGHFRLVILINEEA
jgi:hypothetical protein